MIRIFSLSRRAFNGNILFRNASVHQLLTRNTRQYASKLKKSNAVLPARRPKLAKASEGASSSSQGAITGTFEYPTALRVYSRSAPRIAFLGVVRLAPFVLVVIWLFQVGAEALSSPEPLNWPLVLQAGASLLPILLVTPMTSGYVARILVQLPPQARLNKEMLKKWMSDIPGDTLLEIKTVRANGFSWATDQCLLKDLRARKPTWLRKGNFERHVDPSLDKRRSSNIWTRLYALASEPPRILNIVAEEGLKSKLVKEPKIWPLIEEQIKKRSNN
ncbi:uncharacterized protein PV09_01956 [Verruconis gallopava]|uniref:Uncharacterized protein n=1 Tax=Verruconis gallopava TaxID=253628 RepID=A0A0D1XWE8_9PEZI|nr:uncharacterized protein PV09_01956 [Verruconis gallopava]KIW07066.1 hypothetical protein PV09_01956 [Verruconis gallopava]